MALLPSPATLPSPALFPGQPAGREALWRPTVAQVAALERTRTVGESSGGLGGDTGPEPLTTFTDSTRPTAAEVDELIDQALEPVLNQLPLDIPARFEPRVAHLVALYTALLIEGSYFREQIDEGSAALWRNLFEAGVRGLRTAVEEARVPTALRLS